MEVRTQYGNKGDAAGAIVIEGNAREFDILKQALDFAPYSIEVAALSWHLLHMPRAKTYAHQFKGGKTPPMKKEV